MFSRTSVPNKQNGAGPFLRRSLRSLTRPGRIAPRRISHRRPHRQTAPCNRGSLFGRCDSRVVARRAVNQSKRCGCCQRCGCCRWFTACEHVPACEQAPPLTSLRSVIETIWSSLFLVLVRFCFLDLMVRLRMQRDGATLVPWPCTSGVNALPLEHQVSVHRIESCSRQCTRLQASCNPPDYSRS